MSKSHPFQPLAVAFAASSLALLGVTFAQYQPTPDPVHFAASIYSSGLCGNGQTDDGEQCDWKNFCTNGQPCDCTNKCQYCTSGSCIFTPPGGGTTAVCGNGIKESREQCDLGSQNGVWPSKCSTACKTNKAPKAVCGNGTVETGEQCDWKNFCTNGQPCDCTNKCRYCTTGDCIFGNNTTTSHSTCGNGIKEGSEQCDLGTQNGSSGQSDCSKTCRINH